MKKRKALSLLLAGTLTVLSFAGCAGKSGGTASNQAATTEIPTIKMTLLCAAKPTDQAKVEAEIDKITKEKIGANIQFLPIEIGNWQQRMNIILSGGGDTVDVFLAGGVTSFPSLITNGQVMPLDQYMGKYADQMKKSLTEEVYNCGYVNGKYYGVPRYLDMASGLVYNLRKDVADQFSIQNGQKMTLDELTDLFTKMRAKYPTTPFIGTSSVGIDSNSSNDVRIDTLGDSNMLGVLDDPAGSTKVVNYYESDKYKQMVGYYKKWKALKVYMADPLNNTEQPQSYLKSGKCLGNLANHFSASLNGVYCSQNYGVPVVSVSLLNAVATTPQIFYCVSPTSKNPDKAVAWMNLMATNADIENLLCNGIKDTHYTTSSDGVAHYVSGKNASNTGWSIGFSWTQLNSPLSHPFEYPADYFKQMVKTNTDSPKSKAFGFQFNATSVTNEISACTNVVSQYKPAIECGATDNIDAMVTKFQAALKSAGVDKIVQAKQTQLDKYLSEKK